MTRALAIVMLLGATAVAQPISAKVINVEVHGDSTLVVTLDKGSDVGVARGWKCRFQFGKRTFDAPIIRVKPTASIAVLKGVTWDQIPGKLRCELEPPP